MAGCTTLQRVNASSTERRQMNVLVTGGGGFIGSHVVDLLIKEKHDVCVVDNFSTGKRENIHDSAAFAELDIRSEALQHLIGDRKPQTIIHLAAQMNVTFSVKNPKLDAHCNVLGLINLLEACVEHDVKRVIFASTGGAIGLPPF